jgi:hypothetical protein
MPFSQIMWRAFATPATNFSLLAVSFPNTSRTTSRGSYSC